MTKTETKTADDILAGLNRKQQEAVTTIKGPLLILAGAGSGKTKALTHRIAYLLITGRAEAGNILGVTFTNKAAAEMRERVERLLKGRVRDMPLIGTFHSICAGLLRREGRHLGFSSDFTIYDVPDQIALMKKVMQDLGISEKTFSPKALLAHISSAKNDLIGPEKYEIHAIDSFTGTVAKAYHPYQQYLKEANAIDFDDLIMHVVRLFNLRPDVLERYQDRFRFILVDEYQDTNFAQYILVKMLAEKYRNLCCIGDDWQGIYSWRGATIQNILDFQKHYPETKIIKLEQNYRSTKKILAAAHAVITKNEQRTDKELWTENKDGHEIQIYEAQNERAEAEAITQEVMQLMNNTNDKKMANKNKGGDAKKARCSYNDFAVLYRVNAQSRGIEEAFLRAGIPYQIVGGTRFYERREIKDIVAYLRILANQQDIISLMRIINVPLRGIGTRTIAKLRKTADESGKSLLDIVASHDLGKCVDGNHSGIESFVRLFKKLQWEKERLVTHELIELIIKESGYKEYVLDGTRDGDDRYQNLRELIAVSTKYSELPPKQSLRTFLEEVALLSDIDSFETRKEAVTLMTLHSAKGLEFTHVFIPGMEEGIFPHSRSSIDPQALEEERRLAYVGITRAKERLYLLCATKRLYFGGIQMNPRSRFLHDIPKELVEWKYNKCIPDFYALDKIGKKREKQESGQAKKLLKKKFSDGDRVSHPSFGEGIVVQQKDDILSIAFVEAGIKKMAADIAPLKRLK